MSDERQSQKTDWLSPGTLIQILAMAALTLSAYWQFREADGDKIADLSKAVALLEYRVAQLEKTRHP